MTHTHALARGWHALFARGLPVWQLNLLFWGLFGAIAFGVRLFMGVPLWHAVVSTVIVEGMCLLLAFALRGIYRRSRRDFGLSSAFRMIFLSFAAAVVQGAMTVAVSLWIGWYNPWFALPVGAFLRLLFVWTTFMMWSLGYYWLWADTDRSREQDRRKEAQREAQRMELQMLRAQLDPHFLFNSLNGIAAEIRPHPDIAVEMVGELSDYLRYSLDHRKQPIARLSTELGAMESYLRIERARFGHRLHFHVEASEPARRRLVPSFLLQPLVENAVKYGLDRSAAGLDIDLHARVEGNLLEITVANSGSLAPAEASHPGIGLETLRRRLELHYPQRHAFTLAEHDGRVIATLQLWDPPCSA